MAAAVHMFTCLSDNFGVLLHDPATGATAAIDVPEAEPVLAAAKEKGWTISHVLVTHHHPDHVQGIEAVKAATGARVIANASDSHRIPLVDETVVPGGKARFGSLEADVIDTPGHTVGHIAYHFAAEKLLFAGDTLFSLGCGRLFEGTPQQMWDALKVLRALPDDTAVYCGHEYTASNAKFSLVVDPDNAALKAAPPRCSACARGQGDAADDDRAGEGDEPLPARRRPGHRRQSRHARPPAGRGLRRAARAQEQGLIHQGVMPWRRGLSR